MPAPKSGPLQVILKPTAKELGKRNAKRLRKLKNSKVAYAKVSIMLDRWVQDNFKTEGGKVGGWLPLQAGGRYKGGVFDPSAKILQDEGRLRSSFLPFATRSNAGIGSDLPYSKKHEEGLVGMPERRMLPERGEVIDEAIDILREHVKRSTK